MATKYLLTESSTGRVLGLFKSFDSAHAYAQARIRPKTRKVDGQSVVEYAMDAKPKRDPVPESEWHRHYLYNVAEVEVE